MMLLSYTELELAVELGVMKNVAPGAINAASIDVRLGSSILVENKPNGSNLRDLSAREPLSLRKVEMYKDGFILMPGQFILGHTMETFDLPDDMSAQFMLKSSMARNGLEHANATWCDAGWNNSTLTLEIRNVTQYHRLLIKPGMFVGQCKIYAHAKVPPEQSYRVRGRYNHDSSVSGIKP